MIELQPNRRLLFTLFFSLFVMLFNNDAFSQNYWMERAGGTTIDEAYSISLDGNENTYTTGYFSGTATFGTTTLSSSGISDVFVACTDKNGVYQWAVKAGGAGSCRGLAIQTDASGNSFVTGFFEGTATFGTKSITSAGLEDAFVAKYDNTGTIQWVVSAGGTMNDIGNAIAIDNSDNVLVTGEFAGTAHFGSFSLTAVKTNINVFTTKLDASGNFLWAKGGTGPHTDRGLGVACDGSGNVYVTGQYTDTVTFDNVHYSSLYDAIFLVKYNSSGNEQWFTKAGGGTLNIANGIAVDGSSNVYLTGNFTGTLSFFASPTVTLSGTYANRIFVAKYNSGGSLLWDVSDASSNPVTANSISLDASGNAYIIGNFECIMNSYADHYGQGTFNTVGYWDIFVAEYGSGSGAWQWSRQIGGKKDNLGYSIAASATGDVFTAGSFDQDMTITSGSGFVGYKTSSIFCNNPYCADSYYGDFQTFQTAGNYDIFIAKPIDLTRQPYDYYTRDSSACVRPFVGVCVDNGCPDTVKFCGGGSIFAMPHTCPQAGPDFNYLWSTGGKGSSSYVSATGWYSVTQTTVDGCFKSTDSIYVVIHPFPVQPNISDNIVINTNATSPKPINLCQDSVKLTGGGYGTNTYSWSGGKTASTLSIEVTKSGYYCFNVTNSFGCSNQTCISVTIDTALQPIKPKLICVSCSHDTAAFCQGGSFTMFTYDSISNPTALISDCIPPSAEIKWFSNPTTISFPTITYCPGSAENNFTPSDSGWYHITDTIIRANLCDTLVNVAHDSVYVRLYPVPKIGGLSITGHTNLCPGDSTWLVAHDTMSYTWSTGGSADSIHVGPGTYSITSKVTNKYGCSAVASTAYSVTVKTVPTITISPNNGLICPGDSLLLTCTGGTGNYSWSGPSGPFGGNTVSVYVKTAGYYFCVVTDTALYCNPILSNSVVVNVYATPYLAATPNPVICPGDSVKLLVIASSGASIQWQSPLSGSDSIQLITKPGTYSCLITSCGITTNAGITITASFPVAKITATGPLTFCDGDSVTLTANTGMAIYVWEPIGVSATSVVVTNPGTYTLLTTDSYGCTAKDTTLVKVNPDNTLPPRVTDTVVCPGETVTLLASASGNITWYSAPSGGTVLATGTSYTTPALNGFVTYYIDALDGDCRSSRDSISVSLTDCGGIYVPNVFTPNGDGQNDVFIPTIKGAKCFDCKIYNRWGVLIYEWNDISKGWDGIVRQTGLPASDGTYYYIMDYCTYLDVPGQRDGFLTLIRN